MNTDYQDEIGFENGQIVESVGPDADVAPELELLNELEEVGVKLSDRALCVAIVSDWIQRHQNACNQRAFDQRQAVATILLRVSQNAKAQPLRTGQNVFSLLHHLRLGNWKTQRDLASRLRLTPGRVSQLLNSAKAVFRL